MTAVYPEQGIHQMPADQYHADPAEGPSLSASIAHTLITQSPAHAKARHPRLNPTFVREEDDKFDIGNCVHAYLLEGRDIIGIVEADSWRTKDAKTERDQIRNSGKIPLLGKNYDEVMRMVDAVAAQLPELDVAPIPFTEGKPEQTLIWTEGGVACRARLDWLRDDLVTVDDLKTTSRSAEPSGWSRNTMFSIGSDTQAAFYLRGVKAVTGVDARFRWAVAETQPPYALSVITPGADVLALANRKIDYALDVWKRCLETDVWPAYPVSVVEAELPAWEESRWYEREAREGIAA